LGVLGFPYALARDARPDLLAAWVAAGLLAWMYRPRGGEITFANMRLRVQRQGMWRLAGRMAALAAVSALASMALGVADAWLAAPLPGQPLFPANPWLRAALGSAEAARGEGGSALGAGHLAALLALAWLRGAALALALVPIVLVLRGRRSQMAMVFTLLPFAVGDFAPLMESQPFPSQAWLMLRVGLSGMAALAVGAAAAWLIAQPPPDEPPERAARAA
jgi:hypothetical protein